MNKRTAVLVAVLGAGVLLLWGILSFALRENPPDVAACVSAGRAARLSPDYTDTTIPPNIAPLNFTVKEPGSRYFVRISSAKGAPVDVVSRTAGIAIPIGAWRELLESNRGGKLYFDVCVKDGGRRWRRFDRIVNTVAREEIDGWLVYREMPAYNLAWTDMGIYQRNLSNFDVSTVLHNGSFQHGCVNCHTFLGNRTRKMAMNVRSSPIDNTTRGMLITDEDSVSRIVDTKTAFNDIPAIYLSWHPSGKAIAFSTNKILQCFHTVGNHRDTFDTYSNIALYLIDSNTITTSPAISRTDRMETYPTWSPDGRTMYFCSAPQLPIEKYQDVRYDLMRIRYDIDNDTWGEPQLVLSSLDTKLSISHPRISPDGKFLLCCMTAFGNFPAFSPSSDLYMLDLKTGKCEKLAVNSDESDAFHSWSSNSRWIVFSSKRRDGMFARPYFSRVDDNGVAARPFLLPQEDPSFYDSYIRVYNLPELVSEPVRVTRRAMTRSLYQGEKAMKAKLDPRVKPMEKPVTQPPGPTQYVE